MYTFPELLKRIRQKSGLTQDELARALDVSTVLISMIETGQKEASKGFVKKLADRLDVQPGSILPFVFVDKIVPAEKLPGPERALIKLGEQLQVYLVETKSKKLQQYV